MASADLRSLLPHVEGLAKLAGDLLGDASAGDDVAQEAAIRALQAQARPATPDQERRWLLMICRRLVATEWLRRSRRRDHEFASSAHRANAAAPSSAAIAERAEIAELLHGRIRVLPEPFRTAITDRYLGGLPPTTIAARDDVSVETVKSRLRKAKRLLRADLERRGIDGAERWTLSLTPLAGLSPTTSLSSGAPTATLSSAATIGSVLMIKPVAASLAVVAALGLVWMATESHRATASNAIESQGPGMADRGHLAAVGAAAPYTQVLSGGIDGAETEARRPARVSLGGLEVQVRTVDDRPVDAFGVTVALSGASSSDYEELYDLTGPGGSVRFQREDLERIQQQLPRTPLVASIAARVHEPVSVELPAGTIPDEPVVLVVDMMRVVVSARAPDGALYTGRMGLSVRPDEMGYHSSAGPPPRVGWVPRGRGYTLKAYRCGLWADAKEHFPRPKDGELEREHTIALSSPIPGITGRIVYPGGSPLGEGEYLQIIDRARAGNGSRPINVDADGRFSYALRLGEASGQSRLFDFVLGGKNGSLMGRTLFTVGAPGAYLDLGDIVLEQQQLLVSGCLVVPEGIGAKGMAVSIDTWNPARGWERHPILDNCVFVDEQRRFAVYGDDMPGPERLRVDAGFRNDASELVHTVDLGFEPGQVGLRIPLVRPGAIHAQLDGSLLEEDRAAHFVLFSTPDASGAEFELSRFRVERFSAQIDATRVPPGEVRVVLLAGQGGAPIESWDGFRVEQGATTDLGLLARRTAPAEICLTVDAPAGATVGVRYGVQGVRPLPHVANVRSGRVRLPIGDSPIDLLVHGAGLSPRLLEGVDQDVRVELRELPSVTLELNGTEAIATGIGDPKDRVVTQIRFEPVACELLDCFPPRARLSLRTDRVLGRSGTIPKMSTVALPLPGRWSVELSLRRYLDVMLDFEQPREVSPRLALGQVSSSVEGDPVVLAVDLADLVRLQAGR